MKPEVKRKSQVGIGFAILVFAIIISYFSVEEIDTQEIPQYDIYRVIDVSGSMGTCLDGDWISTCYNVGVTNDSPITFAKKAAIEFVTEKILMQPYLAKYVQESITEATLKYSYENYIAYVTSR